MKHFALVGVVSGFLMSSASLRADEAEDRAVKFVTKIGGKVTRDENQPGKPVVAVVLNFTELTDAGLTELSVLRNLTSLDLTRTQVTDQGLKELKAFKGLTALGLGGTRVTDKGVKELAAHANLTTLFLNNNLSLTDTGLKELSSLKNLATLNISSTKVTDAGVDELQKALPKCKISK